MDRVEDFIDDNQIIVAHPLELFDSDLPELLSELQQVGCTAVVVDPVTMGVNVTITPIQELGGLLSDPVGYWHRQDLEIPQPSEL